MLALYLCERAAKIIIAKMFRIPLIFVLKTNPVSCKTKRTWCPSHGYFGYLELAKGTLHGRSSVVFCSFASLYSCEKNQMPDQVYCMYSSNES